MSMNWLIHQSGLLMLLVLELEWNLVSSSYCNLIKVSPDVRCVATEFLGNDDHQIILAFYRFLPINFLLDIEHWLNFEKNMNYQRWMHVYLFSGLETTRWKSHKFQHVIFMSLKKKFHLPFAAPCCHAVAFCCLPIPLFQAKCYVIYCLLCEL